MMNKKIYSIILFLGIVFSLQAQETVTIKGTVKSKSNAELLPGVSVVVKGTTTGTLTDIDGNYEISISSDAILVFSFVGFKSQEVIVLGKSIIDIQLEEESTELDDVVVVAYGLQKPRDITGAISKIDAKQISLQPVTTFESGLQGLSSGLQIGQHSGTPGSAVRIQIRGTGSINAGTEPLYVIDGIPLYQDFGSNNSLQAGSNDYQSPLADINPNDIESYSILKDASATALYGSRGANGVILITTKTGKKGESKINFNYYQGITMPSKTLDFVNTTELFDMLDQSRTNVGITSSVPYVPELNTALTSKAPDLGWDLSWSRLRAKNTNVNQLDEFLRNGKTQAANFNISNADDKTRYYISFDYKNEDGIANNNNFKRYNGRVNLDYNAKKWLNMGTKLSLSLIDNNRPITGSSVSALSEGKTDKGSYGGFWAANLRAVPYFPVYDQNNNYYYPISGKNIIASTNPSNIKDNLTQYRSISSAYMELIPLKDLKIKYENSIDYINKDENFWLSNHMRLSSYAQNNSSKISINNQLLSINFAKKIHNHDFSILAATEATHQKIFSNIIIAENVTDSNYRQIGEFQEPITDVLVLLNGIDDDQKMLAYFSRLNYKFMDRYLFEASLRRDASSRFNKEIRWDWFPAISAGWIVSDEEFLKDLPIINFLKIRASYGLTGNDKIPQDRFMDAYITWPVYAAAPAYVLSDIASTVTWEISKKTDIALEYGILKSNRISGSFGYYRNLTDGMLLYAPVSYAIGIGYNKDSRAWFNVGNILNQGVEIEIKSQNIDKRDFKWSSVFNFTTNKNIVQELTDVLKERPTGVEGSNTVTRVGHELGEFYLAEYAGIDENGYEQVYKIDSLKAIDGVFEKTGDKVRATQKNVDKNKMPLGKSGIPTFFGGISNTITYKNISLNILFSGQGGNYLYDNAEIQLSNIDDGAHNVLQKVYNNTWTPENPNAEYPMLRFSNLQSPETDDKGGVLSSRHSKYLYKGDFIKLRNITLSYNISDRYLKYAKIQGARIYVTAQNLLTITGYKGYDPEYVQMNSRNISQGYINEYTIPQIRTYTAGISFNF